MKSRELSIPASVKWRAVGSTMLLLRGDYDPAQEWLPFVQALVASSDAASPEWDAVADGLDPQAGKPVRKRKGDLTARWDRPDRIQPPSWARRMHVYQKGVEQMTLPFAEHRHISHKELDVIANIGYPGFERNPDGAIAEVRIGQHSGHREAAKSWCAENCRGRYHIGGPVITFERFRDATLAALFLA